MNSNQRAAIKTLIYADVFDFCLTVPEIWQRWIGHKSISLDRVKEVVDSLVNDNQVATRKGYYFLPGRDQLTIIRRNRLKDSTDKHVIAAKIGRGLMMIPTVEAVFVTGTVAVGNAEANDDIDMMVVTSAGRLWMTRLGVTGLLEMKGLRRRPNQKECKDKICVNLYLDANHMSVPVSQRNLYTAHEVIQAKPILDRNQIMAAIFMAANRWVKDFLPNTLIPKAKIKSVQRQSSGLENVAFRLQKMYMASRISREIITPSAAYFHPKDTAKIVLDRYNLALKDHNVS